MGVFAEEAAGRFELTPLAEALRSDVPGSVRAMCAMRGERWFTGAWAELRYSVTTGEPGFDHAFGRDLFGFLKENPPAMALFAEAMSSMSGAETAALLSAYDFSAASTIAVDRVPCGPKRLSIRALHREDDADAGCSSSGQRSKNAGGAHHGKVCHDRQIHGRYGAGPAEVAI
ncbi:MAG: methyltransferase [Acidimicrobiales bacterium]